MTNADGPIMATEGLIENPKNPFIPAQAKKFSSQNCLFPVFCLGEDESLLQEGDGMSAGFYLRACSEGKSCVHDIRGQSPILYKGFIAVFVI